MDERIQRAPTHPTGNAWLDRRRIGLVAGGAAILALLVFGVWSLSRPNYEPVLKALSQESHAEVLALLTAWGVPHRLDPDEAILVPAEQAAAVRTRLNAQGVTTRERAGLELFGEADQGMSEFSQRINYQRALEGELERTIQALAEVRSARVHLTLAKSSIFENKREAAKGSVVLQLKPEHSLSARQIDGIQQLVAAAVTDMQAEHVVVLDEMGRSLSSGEADGNEHEQLGHQLQLESIYEERARGLIGGLLPGVDVHLSVRLQLNFDRMTSVREDLIPAGDSSEGYLLKGARDAKSGNAEYAFGRERAEIRHAPGAIEHLHVGVVVAKPLTDAQIESIEAVLAAGLGITKEDGDTLAVVGSEPPVIDSAATPVTVVWGDPSQVEAEPESETERASSNTAASSPTPAWSMAGLGRSMLPWVAVLLVAVVLMVALRRGLFGRRGGSIAPALTEQERRQILLDARRWLEVS